MMTSVAAGLAPEESTVAKVAGVCSHAGTMRNSFVLSTSVYRGRFLSLSLTLRFLWGSLAFPKFCSRVVAVFPVSVYFTRSQMPTCCALQRVPSSHPFTMPVSIPKIPYHDLAS